MKRLAFASSVLSLAASMALAPSARSAGFIAVDPAFGGAGMIVPLSTPIVPIPRHPMPPGHPTTPLPHRPVLRGGVSYGLHLESENIKVDITDQVARTYITQTFMNDTDRNLAGTYLFPLPEDTTFSSFSLHIDGKPIEGQILEANAARQQYEEIVRRMVDPGLLEYADYKTVRARIFPIPAHGTKKVELEYTQVLKAENGMLKYRFPLKAEASSVPVDEIKIEAKLSAKQGLRTIWSPTHTITSDRSDNNHAKISLLSHDSVPDKDFLLYYSVSDKDLAANLLTHKNPSEDGYFLLTL
ncbi:MAG TPA: VIT domain-containing protein, partial [Chroococcales cyanobacterium]